MKRAPARLIVFAWALCAGCSLFANVDDLEGDGRVDASAGAGGSSGDASGCSADKGCVGCASCADFCLCSKPFAVEACIASVCSDAGSGGSGGVLDAGNDADADASGGQGGNCSDTSYLGKSCAAVNDGTPCGACTAANCCSEFEACFASEGCARTYACWQNHCEDTADPTQCVTSECPCFSQDSQLLIEAGLCASSKCSVECPQSS
jgi:hypothetical protein